VELCVVRSEGELNSILTAENAEDRRELQRKKENNFVYSRIERAASPASFGPLRSSASSAVKIPD
jgi:hypothetical protein